MMSYVAAVLGVWLFRHIVVSMFPATIYILVKLSLPF